MGYYVRVFCKSDAVPSKAQLDAYVKALNAQCRLEYSEEETNGWSSAELYYKEGKLPVLVEVNMVDDQDGLAKEEVEEFIEDIGAPWLSLSKRKVLNHLRGTKYVVACQLPTSDIDDDGYNANSFFLNFFVKNHDGMLQADGEGFYKGNKLILENK